MHEFTRVDYFWNKRLKIQDVATGNKHCLASTTGECLPGQSTIKPTVYIWGSNEAYQQGVIDETGRGD